MTIPKLLITLVLLVVLNGCGFYGTYKEGFKSEAKKAADELMLINIYGICKANSSGALTRQFMTGTAEMTAQERFNMWQMLCLGKKDDFLLLLENGADDSAVLEQTE